MVTEEFNELYHYYRGGGWIGAQIGDTYLCLRFHHDGHFTRSSDEQAHIIMQDKDLGQNSIIHWH